MKMTMKERARVEALLDRLTDLIIDVGRSYEGLGVDYMGLREMGAGTDLLGPQVFKSLIQPRLQPGFSKPGDLPGSFTSVGPRT